MAEWLRRLPAKQFPFGSVGSNPAVVVFWRKREEGRLGEHIKRQHKKKKKSGGAGYRSPCPSHAKRMLYHMSYTPNQGKGGKGEVDCTGKEEKKEKTLQRGFEPRSFT